MGSEFDASEFVDDDFQTGRKATPAPPAAGAAAASDPHRAPTRQELEAQVGEMQHKLAELKRAQQDLERERTAIEETRRRQVEFTAGRQEMTDQLTRGIALLEEAEFASRRDAEQMSKSLAALREALQKVQAVREDAWTKENLSVELTKANTVIENARMEWNGARLKYPILTGAPAAGEAGQGPAAEHPAVQLLRDRNYAELCKLGLALTWPVALAGLLVFLVLLMRR